MKNVSISVLGSIVGVIVGGTSIYWKMEGEMEEEITRRVRIETRIERLETQYETLKSELWTLRTTNKLD